MISNVAVENFVAVSDIKRDIPRFPNVCVCTLFRNRLHLNKIDTFVKSAVTAVHLICSRLDKAI